MPVAGRAPGSLLRRAPNGGIEVMLQKKLEANNLEILGKPLRDLRELIDLVFQFRHREFLPSTIHIWLTLFRPIRIRADLPISIRITRHHCSWTIRLNACRSRGATAKTFIMGSLRIDITPVPASGHIPSSGLRTPHRPSLRT